MGHFVLILMHLAALVFLLPALFITVPMHVIYAAVSARSAARVSQAAPTPPSDHGNGQQSMLSRVAVGLAAGALAALALLFVASLFSH